MTRYDLPISTAFQDFHPSLMVSNSAKSSDVAEFRVITVLKYQLRQCLYAYVS